MMTIFGYLGFYLSHQRVHITTGIISMYQHDIIIMMHFCGSNSCPAASMWQRNKRITTHHVRVRFTPMLIALRCIRKTTWSISNDRFVTGSGCIAIRSWGISWVVCKNQQFNRFPSLKLTLRHMSHGQAIHKCNGALCIVYTSNGQQTRNHKKCQSDRADDDQL